MIAFLVCTAGPCMAGGISGKVIDAQTHQPIAGASVVVAGTKLGAGTDRTGAYLIQEIPPGTYTVIARSVAHIQEERRVVIGTGDVTLPMDFMLQPRPATAPEVVITGRLNRETDAAARFTEQSAPSVMNVLSAQSIARYPDASTAEIAKRIPGISITRVRGEAREAIVRGMEGRYNNTMIDGVKAPSPSTNTHVVQLDYLPSDLLQRVEVTKSLTPDMEADAIGGSVNLVMRTAPDQFVLRARAGGGYNSVLLGNQFVGFRTDSILDDPLEVHGRGYQAKASDFTRDNLKLVRRSAAPNYLGEFTLGDRFLQGRLGLLLAGSVQHMYQRSEVTRNYDAVDADNNIYLIRRQYRQHDHDKTKIGANAKADYILDERNNLQLSFVGFVRRNLESRILNDSNYVFSPVLYLNDRSVVQTYTLADVVLSGDHRLGDLSVKWRGGWAEARQTKPDRAELTTSAALKGDTVVSDRVFYAVVRDWQHNEDRDLFGGADVSYALPEDAGLTFTAGTLYRAKERGNYQNEYRLNPVPDSLGRLPMFTSIDTQPWEVLNTGGTPEYANNNYSCTEDVAAVYAMAMWRSGNWNVLAGARMEAVNAHFATYDVNALAQISADKSYTDILPSVHVRYALTDAANLRLSAGQSISHPNYFDLVPYNYVGEDFREMGNPNLKRTLSTNVDLKYEVFPEVNRQFALGLFYKAIENPIESTLDVSNPAIPTITPKNLGNATNYGVEATAGMDLPWHFNVQANYTWTHSAITTPKVLNDRASGRALIVQETRPMQGQSEHIANLALAYSNEDIGSFVQLSLMFTGRRITQVSVYKGLDHYENDFALLDLSADQQLVENLSLFLRVNNLLNAAYEVVIRNGPLVEREVFGTTFTLGINYHY